MEREKSGVSAGPQRGGPQRGGPQRGGPQQGGPQQGGPQQGTPFRGQPQQREPKQCAPQQCKPQRGGPQRGVPQRGGPYSDPINRYRFSPSKPYRKLDLWNCRLGRETKRRNATAEPHHYSSQGSSHHGRQH